MVAQINFSVVIKRMNNVPLKEALSLREAISKTIKSKGYEVYGEGYNLETAEMDISFTQKTHKLSKTK